MRVEVKDYVKTIGKATVLDHVSYTFESGKIYGLRGKNGSGKTMLMAQQFALSTRRKGACA